MYVDERDIPIALNAATRIATYNHRWYHESSVGVLGRTSASLLIKACHCLQFPSAVGHQIFRLIQQEGISKVSYSLVSMRLPDQVLKIMQCVSSRSRLQFKLM